MTERRNAYEEKLAKKKRVKKKTFETDDDIATSALISKSSQEHLSIDLSDLSNETEYLSVPLGDSSSKDVKEHLKRRVDRADRIEKSHKKYQQESHRRPRTPTARRISMDSVESTDEITSRDVSSSPHRSPRQGKKFDEPKKSDRSCENEECSGKPKRQRSPSYLSEISSSDPSCPELCELDELKIPEPKQRCESSCPSQIIEDEQREMDQAEVDRFVLYGGLRYFDDLCHCSLKCLLIQIFGDKFVQKTASSAFFFAMGMKLCYELDSWFIPF
ncbi:uncharacterized protein [Chelonus insularis]|uniref:uncharacterized protein n=1 Tax=Chelonus insularis TaxID=460826 RepID=UPI00158D9553|nr:uncharacterized protein LOC118063975 [Chelonus insularis]